jgi:hypothetical protein
MLCICCYVYCCVSIRGCVCVCICMLWMFMSTWSSVCVDCVFWVNCCVCRFAGVCMCRKMYVKKQHFGAEEACWAHNPKVVGSRPTSANLLRFLTKLLHTTFQYSHHHTRNQRIIIMHINDYYISPTSAPYSTIHTRVWVPLSKQRNSYTTCSTEIYSSCIWVATPMAKRTTTCMRLDGTKSSLQLGSNTVVTSITILLTKRSFF